MRNIAILLQFLSFSVLLLNLTNICASENVKKSVEENRDDNGDTSDDKEESLEIPMEAEQVNVTCTRRHNSQMHGIKAANIKQFPFMAAIMSQQFEYLCAGSVVSQGLILTTATCIQGPITYVLLNATTAKKDESAVVLHIIESEKFPTFSGGQGKDVGVIFTEKHNSSVASKISLSNYTNTNQIQDIEVLGYGLNSEVGQNKELQYVGLERRSAVMDNVPGDEARAYLDCVEIKGPTCFKDKGGPVIFGNQLMGIVIRGQNDCHKDISSLYAINKMMVDFLPTYTFKSWLDDRIKKNNLHNPTTLLTYPSKPVAREAHHVLTTIPKSFSGAILINTILVFFSVIVSVF